MIVTDTARLAQAARMIEDAGGLDRMWAIVGYVERHMDDPEFRDDPAAFAHADGFYDLLLATEDPYGRG